MIRRGGLWPQAVAGIVAGLFFFRPSSAGAIIAPDHVLVVIEENHDYNQIIGDPNAPYINHLASTGLSFENSHAIALNSLVNYLDLFSGSNQGVTDDTDAHFDAPNLASQLAAAGRTFVGYAESMPADGFTGASAPDYVRIHNPWTYFSNLFVGGSNAGINKVFNASNFPTAPGTDYSFLPTVAFAVPNLLDDMHGEDGGSLTDEQLIARGDAWLSSNIDAYAQWAQTHRSLLVVTWDENNYQGANHIPTIVTGDPSLVQPGLSAQPINHFNLLRTLQDMYGVSPLGGSATAAPFATDSKGALVPAPLIPGDADGDGKVGFADLVVLAAHYGQSNATWADGDFNADGSVGFNDLVILAQNYGQGTAAAIVQPARAVPESTLLGYAMIGGIALARRALRLDRAARERRCAP